MWKSKSWQLAATGIDSNTLLFGVNIFKYEWTDTKKRVQVSDLSYDIPVYTVKINDIQYEFAAGEISNCVWNFYVYRF